MKQTLHQALNNPNHRWFQPLNDVLAGLTLISIVCIVLETVPSIHDRYHPLLVSLESIALAFFTLEYIARVYSAPKRRAYVLSFFGIVDLLAIVPSFLHLANLTFLKSARVLRILRLLRMIRLAKLTHLHRKKGSLDHHHGLSLINVQIYFLSLFSAILLLGSFIYVLEAHHTGFSSIPEGMLWAADVILGGGIPNNDPQTVAGQLLTLVARFIGLALLGVLVAVTGNMLKTALLGEDPVKPKARRKKASNSTRTKRKPLFKDAQSTE